MVLALVLATALAVPQDTSARDTTIFPPHQSVMRLYTDCDEDRWPWGTAEVYVPKTTAEIAAGIERRRALETAWRAWFAGHRDDRGDSLAPTPDGAWGWPLGVRGRLLDNFAAPRVGQIHGALDIFVPREGVPIRSPVNGVVVASGDDWRGRFHPGHGDALEYFGGGVSRRAGNGIILFDPASGGYFLFSHMRPGLLARTGDVVRRGQRLGMVGHTGNADAPGRGHHLHLAYKLPGTSCGIAGVLVNVDVYRQLRVAQRRYGR